jgi:lycopene beta-cyclase
MSVYLGVLLVAGIAPLVLSFYPPLRFYRTPAALPKTLAGIILIFGSWDSFAVWRGHWRFDPAAVWTTRIVNLPVEEVMFFVVIPFCCIFAWEAVKFLSGKRR